MKRIDTLIIAGGMLAVGVGGTMAYYQQHFNPDAVHTLMMYSEYDYGNPLKETELSGPVIVPASESSRAAHLWASVSGHHLVVVDCPLGSPSRTGYGSKRPTYSRSDCKVTFQK